MQLIHWRIGLDWTASDNRLPEVGPQFNVNMGSVSWTGKLLLFVSFVTVLWLQCFEYRLDWVRSAEMNPFLTLSSTSFDAPCSATPAHLQHTRRRKNAPNDIYTPATTRQNIFRPTKTRTLITAKRRRQLAPQTVPTLTDRVQLPSANNSISLETRPSNWKHFRLIRTILRAKCTATTHVLQTAINSYLKWWQHNTAAPQLSRHEKFPTALQSILVSTSCHTFMKKPPVPLA